IGTLAGFISECWPVFDRNGGRLHVGIRTEFDQFSMIIEAAVAGMGYALLPRYLIEQELKSGELQVVLDLPMETENSYYAVLPEVSPPSATCQRFICWLIVRLDARLEVLEPYACALLSNERSSNRASRPPLSGTARFALYNRHTEG
ncbi:LysR substrate-binding domain-containing protein, partial [Mesorhizobium sp. M0208]